MRKPNEHCMSRINGAGMVWWRLNFHVPKRAPMFDFIIEIGGAVLLLLLASIIAILLMSIGGPS